MIKNEWKSLWHNKFMLIVVVAIIAIPLIYAGLFLKSMWDPYGSVENLPVAVVNNDKSVTLWMQMWLNRGLRMEPSIW